VTDIRELSLLMLIELFSACPNIFALFIGIKYIILLDFISVQLADGLSS
jgi:hypothetical protein